MDDLRLILLKNTDTLLKTGGGIFTREELSAIIRHRIWKEKFGYVLLLFVTIIGAVAAVFAAVEGWPKS